MFANACERIRESVYGIMSSSVSSGNQTSISTGTGFMVAPGIVASAAHVMHLKSDHSQPLHSHFRVIRAPDIGQDPEQATFIAEDTIHDIALLRITSPRSQTSVQLATHEPKRGTNSGSLGFPFSSMTTLKGRPLFNLTERFQGAYLSGFSRRQDASGANVIFYETDALMYPGSSGCPAFLGDGMVIGMQKGSVTQGATKDKPGQRVAISLWVPSTEIIAFAQQNGITL